MSKEIKMAIRIPSDASSRNDTPYLEHTQFITFCKVNKVDIGEYELEQYEKNKLLYPCCRILYPRELLRRDFHARHSTHSQSYKVRDEWEPLISLKDLMFKSRHWMYKEFDEAIGYGHPFERAIGSDNPYIVEPERQKFKRWNSYKVIVDKYDTRKIRESRVKHYYSHWKVFIAYDLKVQNTDEHNRATGMRRGWGIWNNKLRESSLIEFSQFFKIVASFTYRRSLLTTYYFEKTQKKQQDWKQIIKKKRDIAKKLFSEFEYVEWLRFLRKLIEVHERYRGDEKILLSLEAKSSIERTVIFLRYATNYKFERICDDVSGKFKKRFGVGIENGVEVHPGRLEELFPDEKWDLEQNVRWLLNHDLKQFNSSLLQNENIPESLAGDLFDELSKEPSGTALAAMRKINKSYFNHEIWRENEVWSGVRDLAVSIEVHGKDWVGGNKLNDVLTTLFPSIYDAMKKQAGIPKITDASSTTEFLNKLKIIQKLIPANKRCGNHLLIAHLTRNFSNHQKGLSGKHLHENLPLIYSSLVRTFFLLYAKYKGML